MQDNHLPRDRVLSTGFTVCKRGKVRMILVTGATGNVGRPIVHRLLEQGAKVRVFVRDRARLGDVADKVEVVVGDFTNDTALRTAMRGVDRLYLHAIGDANEEVTAAMAAAQSEGVAHVVHLSSLSASLPGPSAAQWFLGREAIVTGAGLEWTIVRPGFFMSNVLRWVPSIRNQGVVRWISGRFAPVDTRDVGAVAAAALTEPGHEGRIYDLTGPDIMDSKTQVEIISDVLRRPIEFDTISVDNVVAGLRATGVPEARIAFARAVAEALANNEWPVVTDTVERVTGHKARTFRQWCIEHTAAFGFAGAPAGHVSNTSAQLSSSIARE